MRAVIESCDAEAGMLDAPVDVIEVRCEDLAFD